MLCIFFCIYEKVFSETANSKNNRQQKVVASRYVSIKFDLDLTPISLSAYLFNSTQPLNSIINAYNSLVADDFRKVPNNVI